MADLPLILLGLAVIGAAGWAIFRGARVAAEEKQANDIADQVQNDVGAMPPDKRREELRKWSD